MALLRQIVNHGVERHLTKGFPGKVPVPRVAAAIKDDDLSPPQLAALLVALDTDTDQVGGLGYLRDTRAAFERIRTSATLPEGFRLLHGCRHHFATTLVAAGVDMLTVASLLGHTNAHRVMRRYAHVRPGVLAKAAELSWRLIEQVVTRAREEQAAKT